VGEAFENPVRIAFLSRAGATLTRWLAQREIRRPQGGAPVDAICSTEGLGDEYTG